MKRCQTRERSCSSNRQRGVRSNYQGRRWREGDGRKQQPSHLNLPQGGPSVGRRISRDNLKTGDTRKWEGGSLESSSSTLSVKLLKGFRRLDTEISLFLSLPPSFSSDLPSGSYPLFDLRNFSTTFSQFYADKPVEDRTRQRFSKRWVLDGYPGSREDSQG